MRVQPCETFVVSLRRKERVMCVAAQLGLGNVETGLIREAAAAWQGWGQLEPSLRVVDGLLDLPDWIRSADRDSVDEVLLALARLASPRAGDETAAAAALAWLLLPGARLLAARMRHHCERIDELVASQLWIEVRSFEWERLGKVAANILRSTQSGVLIDLGLGAAYRRADPTWARTTLSDEVVELRPSGDEAPEPDPRAVRLDALMDLALREDVICSGDVALLQLIADSLDRLHPAVATRERGGFCSTRAAAMVATELGVSAVTVRRRVSSCLRALRELDSRIEGPVPA